MARGGDKGGGGYGGSGKGNSGPGAGGAGGRGGGNGPSGGGRGRGDGPAGRAGAGDASEGTGRGNAPSGMGSGGNGGRGSRGASSSTGSNASASGARGPDSTPGAGRRSGALSAFGRIGQSISDAWGGLTQGISDVGQSIGESLGYGRDKAPTFTGSHDHAALQTHIEAQKEKGESLAQRDQAINTVASPVGLNTLTGVATDALSGTLSPTAQMSYDATQEKGLGSLSKTGINALAALKGIPNPVTSTGINLISYGMMLDEGESGRNPQQSRRSNAISAFSGSGSSSGRSSQITSNNQTTPPNAIGWEPSSYGFGDYGSHVRGLLG